MYAGNLLPMSASYAEGMSAASTSMKRWEYAQHALMAEE
jgi:hypothetical protein